MIILPREFPLEVLHIGWVEVKPARISALFDKRRLHLSRLIIAAQIARDYALADISKPIIFDKDACRETGFVAKKLGLSEQQLQPYIPGPPVPHADDLNGMMPHRIFMQLCRWARKHVPHRRHLTAKVTNVD